MLIHSVDAGSLRLGSRRDGPCDKMRMGRAGAGAVGDMPEADSFRISNEIAKKWHDLAVRRRDHLADLYHSGRWRLYFTEQNFLALMRDTVRSVESWAAIAYPKDHAGEQNAAASAPAPAAPALDRDAA